MSIESTMYWYETQMSTLEKYIEDYREGEKEAEGAESKAVSEYNKLTSMARKNGGYISPSEDRAAREYYIAKSTQKSEEKMVESLKKITVNTAEYTNKMAECLEKDDVESVLYLYENLDKLASKTSGIIDTTKTIKRAWDKKVNSDSKILEYNKNRHIIEAKRKITEVKAERRLVKGKYESAKGTYESLINDYEEHLQNKMDEIKNRFKVLNLELDDLNQKYSDNVDGEIFLYRQLNEVKEKEQFDIKEKLSQKTQEKDKLYKDICSKENEKEQLRKNSRRIIAMLEEEIAKAKEEMDKHKKRLDECELSLKGYEAIIKDKK